MPHETVPADIAAAIKDFEHEVRWSEEYGPDRDLDVKAVRAALDAAILKHLRDLDEAHRDEIENVKLDYGSAMDRAD